MASEIELDTLGKTILEVLSSDFKNVKLLAVNVTTDVDSDGDDFLKVEVVFEGEVKDIEPNFWTSAWRSVRPKLSEMEVAAFPSLSFISSTDARLASS